ncbi:MAG: hypothetical protein IPI73_04035 [Betaproteobacteria bacterium]|nr:hypothetical protein [Betaproteobacteria bacterium]
MRMEDGATSVQAYLTGQSGLLATNSVIVLDLAKRDPTEEFDLKFAAARRTSGCAKDEPYLLRWLDTVHLPGPLHDDLDKLHVKWLGGPMTAPLPPL